VNLDPIPESREKTKREKTNHRPESSGFMNRLKNGLSKTREILTTDIDDLFSGKNKIDDEMLEDLEELLITSDIGVQTAMELMARISQSSKKITGSDELKKALKVEILSLLDMDKVHHAPVYSSPHVIMVVGVNGVGKTTTIGKLAAKYKAMGKTVLVAAGDTFRAAAIEQLMIWAERAGAEIVKHRQNADPAAVAFDGVQAASARGIDVVIVDTAGRLHTKINLMEELKKISRSISKIIPDAPNEILLVLDATTGQNAVSQAKLFNDAIGITGIALTKLDGTAKGGIAVCVSSQLNIPLKYIGIGESIQDLQEFKPEAFVDALF
jgi:fused signal recognition particle receptor